MFRRRHHATSASFVIFWRRLLIGSSRKAIFHFETATIRKLLELGSNGYIYMHEYYFLPELLSQSRQHICRYICLARRSRCSALLSNRPSPTDPFITLVLQNPPNDVPELHKTRRSPDFEALKLWKCRSGRVVMLPWKSYIRLAKIG